MSYCLKPTSTHSDNPEDRDECLSFETTLLLQNRYRALRLIGQGSFGRTFLAVDESRSSNRRCVIKQFFPQAAIADHQKAAELFQQEALRLIELGEHPQIPELLNAFEQDGQQYLVQEFVLGQNLEQELVESGAFNEAQIRQLLCELLPVLQFVHDRQVIHRDIKPANIIRRTSLTASREEEQLVLVDFGAAKVATNTGLGRTGTLIGSAEFAAPEQIRGKAVFASDLYSLGVTCIHLLTQMPTFDLFDSTEDGWAWRDYLPTPVSHPLGKLLDKLLQPATKRRYRSATEILQDLNTEPFQVASQFSSTETLEGDINPQLRKLIPPGMSATVFDPTTQSWHRINNFNNQTDIAWAVASFLSTRLATAIATPPVEEAAPQIVSDRNSSRPKHRFQLIQRLRAYLSKALTVESYDAVELVFTFMAIFILITIGAATMICFFEEMELHSPASRSQMQQLVLQSSDGS